MKKALLVIVSLIVTMGSGSAWALTDADGVKLNGQHYNLNIIGVANPKSADMDSVNGTGGVVFVDLKGKSKISLIKNTEAGLDADEYAVLDKNGTDADGALVALPDPGLDPYVVGDKGDADTMSDYSVFVRPLGKPLGWAKITTCAEIVDSELLNFLDRDGVEVLNDAADFGGVASIEQVGMDITFRNKGKTSFTNVTAELLTIVLKVEVWTDLNGDGLETPDELETLYVRVPVFDEILQGEYWEYDNNDLKLLQVRFYPMETDVSAGDGDLPAL